MLAVALATSTGNKTACPWNFCRGGQGNGIAVPPPVLPGHLLPSIAGSEIDGWIADTTAYFEYNEGMHLRIDIVSKMLGMEIPFQRRFAKLQPGEAAIIAQVKGGRLPEGATTLPEGMEIVFILVMVKEHKFC